MTRAVVLILLCFAIGLSGVGTPSSDSSAIDFALPPGTANISIVLTFGTRDLHVYSGALPYAESLDVCATVRANSCTGFFSHEGSPPPTLAISGLAYRGLEAIRSDVYTWADYGVLGRLTLRCIFEEGGINYLVGPFQITGSCQFTSVPSSFRGAWTLGGSQGSSVWGTVLHHAL